jgi:hypothetical protein
MPDVSSHVQSNVGLQVVLQKCMFCIKPLAKQVRGPAISSSISSVGAHVADVDLYIKCISDAWTLYRLSPGAVPCFGVWGHWVIQRKTKKM